MFLNNIISWPAALTGIPLLLFLSVSASLNSLVVRRYSLSCLCKIVANPIFNSNCTILFSGIHKRIVFLKKSVNLFALFTVIFGIATFIWRELRNQLISWFVLFVCYTNFYSKLLKKTHIFCFRVSVAVYVDLFFITSNFEILVNQKLTLWVIDVWLCLKGRLWIHAASKIPNPETIKAMEDFYREIYAVDGVTDIKFPDHYLVSRLLGMSSLAVYFYVLHEQSKFFSLMILSITILA